MTFPFCKDAQVKSLVGEPLHLANGYLSVPGRATVI